jgi:hypothetical protein
VGVKEAYKFVDEMFDQLELFVRTFEDNEQAKGDAQRSRQSRQISASDSFNLSVDDRNRSYTLG